MEDLIKRSDATETVYKALRTPPPKGTLTDTMSLAVALVQDIPSADRPQGEWIESFKRVEVKQGAYIGAKFVHDGWSCSECSEVVEKRYPNCPYCLARMKGANDETNY